MRRLFLLAPLVFAALAFAEVKLPFITAHRGGRLEYDDNALGGFWRSYAAGVRGFETDIRFTRDHRFVVLHDDTLDRTTTGKGYVEEQTLAELDDVRLKVSGERLPTAEEIMNVFKGLQEVSYVKGGKEQLAPSTPRAWVADFTRTAVGPLVMGKELGVRVTALTENGQEEIDIAPQSEDVLHRTM